MRAYISNSSWAILMTSFSNEKFLRQKKAILCQIFTKFHHVVYIILFSPKWLNKFMSLDQAVLEIFKMTSPNQFQIKLLMSEILAYLLSKVNQAKKAKQWLSSSPEAKGSRGAYRCLGGRIHFKLHFLLRNQSNTMNHRKTEKGSVNLKKTFCPESWSLSEYTDMRKTNEGPHIISWFKRYLPLLDVHHVELLIPQKNFPK